jgi:hypothetical protein
VKPQPSEAEFDELKRQRAMHIEKVIRDVHERMGWPLTELHAHVNYGGGTDDCYCNCPEGPCQHEWGGWRDITDEEGRVCGGEQFCQRCGMGSMAHGMRTAP